MPLRNFLSAPRIALQLVAHSKDHVLSQLVALAAPDASVQEAVLDEVRAREAAFPTSLGDGVALPHVRTANVTSVHMSAAVLEKPMPFGASDGNLVDVFFLVLTPSHAPSEHLRILRELSRLVSNPTTVAALRSATTAGAFLATIGNAVGS